MVGPRKASGIRASSDPGVCRRPSTAHKIEVAPQQPPVITRRTRSHRRASPQRIPLSVTATLCSSKRIPASGLTSRGPRTACKFQALQQHSRATSCKRGCPCWAGLLAAKEKRQRNGGQEQRAGKLQHPPPAMEERFGTGSQHPDQGVRTTLPASERTAVKPGAPAEQIPAFKREVRPPLRTSA